MSAIPSNHWLSSPDTAGDGLFLRCLGVSAVVGAVFLTVVMLAPLPRQILKLAAADAPRVARIMFSTPPAVVRAPAPKSRSRRSWVPARVCRGRAAARVPRPGSVPERPAASARCRWPRS